MTRTEKPPAPRCLSVSHSTGAFTTASCPNPNLIEPN